MKYIVVGSLDRYSTVHIYIYRVRSTEHHVAHAYYNNNNNNNKEYLVSICNEPDRRGMHYQCRKSRREIKSDIKK